MGMKSRRKRERREQYGGRRHVSMILDDFMYTAFMRATQGPLAMPTTLPVTAEHLGMDPDATSGEAIQRKYGWEAGPVPGGAVADA